MLFASLFRSLRSASVRPRTARRLRSCSLSVEPLDERCLLSHGICPALVPPEPGSALVAAQAQAAVPLILNGEGAANLAPVLDAEGNPTGALAGSFHAQGTATLLGQWSNVGAAVFTPRPDGTFRADGLVVYTASNGDKLIGTFTDGTLTITGPTTGVGTATFVWIGGTGRFANASGTAPFTVDQNLADGSFTFTTDPGAVVAFDGPAPPSGPAVDLAGSSLAGSFDDARQLTITGSLSGSSPALGGAIQGRFDNYASAAGNKVDGVLVLTHPGSDDAVVLIFQQTFNEETGLYEGSYTIIGGTGDFTGATGSGSIITDADAPGGPLSTIA
jgi:hypothetical protein